MSRPCIHFVFLQNGVGDRLHIYRVDNKYDQPDTILEFYDFFTTPIITAEYTLSFIKNIIGNLMLFMPMGFFLPHLLKKTRQFKYYIILICIIVLSVEIIQLFTTLGMFDIDDVIFNVAGAALGFFLSKRIESAVKRHRVNK